MYVYLTAVAVGLLGRTPLAVRLSAAIVGTLTTWFLYLLAESWFDRRVGLLAAWVWAITVWPIHLSRIGLRPILLPLFLILSLWLATLAYRRQRNGYGAIWLWLLTGAVYGLGFYTYLAMRFTPILIALLALYLALTGRHKALWPGLAWSGLAALVVLAPLGLIAWQQPELVLGRAGQVSLLNPAINEGSFGGALWRHGWQALGLFFVRGDHIVRHNPAGRPMFDLLMAVPFLVGLGWCLVNWRRPAAVAVLLWTVVMLGPTVLAEDTPHFLRAAGVLPAAVMLPAVGLSQLWTWNKLPSRSGQLLAAALVVGSTIITVRDYFIEYGSAQGTGYWFEAAARGLAEDINSELADAAVLVDERFWNGWPSVRFLVEPDKAPAKFSPAVMAPETIEPPAAVYAWPYERLDTVASAISPSSLVSAEAGPMAKGDLEIEAYPLYVRYGVDPPPTWPTLAVFDRAVELRQATVTQHGDRQLQIDLYWSTQTELDRPLVTFVHVASAEGLVGQSDSKPAQGYWPSEWWQPGQVVHDQHIIDLKEDYNDSRQQILIGLYDAETRDRLPISEPLRGSAGDMWLMQP